MLRRYEFEILVFSSNFHDCSSVLSLFFFFFLFSVCLTFEVVDNQIQFLLEVVDHFGEPYLTHIMLPLFLVAVGDDADLKSFPPKARLKIRGNNISLKPFTLRGRLLLRIGLDR